MTVTRVLVLIDDTLSMAGIHPETNRSYLDTAKSIASDFLDALADSRFDVHIVAQTLFLDSDIDPPRSRFNRDWLQMKKEIDLISMSTDRSCNLDAIIKASRLLAGNDDEQPGHLVCLTDGNVFYPRKEFPKMLNKLTCMPATLHILTLGPLQKLEPVTSLAQVVEKTVANGKRASIKRVEAQEVDTAARRLFVDEFAPMTTKLVLGKLSSEMVLHPRPPGVLDQNNTMSVIGFIPIKHLSGPPIDSNHQIIPEAINQEEPHLVILLIHALLQPQKIDRKLALVKIGDRYGLIQAHEKDDAHKWLTFSLFYPGDTPLPWMGSFDSMVFADSSAKQDYPLVDDFAKRRSYATPTIVWSKDNWIIADLQKAHRAAKKLPDKQAAFYKEVNRLSRACCVYSNDSVLEGLIHMLTTEAANYKIPKPKATEEINHCINQLKIILGAINEEDDRKMLELENFVITPLSS